jgi:hypothetical protein
MGGLMPEVTILDLISDIASAAGETRAMLASENGLPLHSGMEEALTRISNVANVLIQQLGTCHGVIARGMGRYPFTRDPEITELLEGISRRLDSMEPLHGTKRDQTLELAERYAAPYAIALFHEVDRLDSLIRQLSPGTITC